MQRTLRCVLRPVFQHIRCSLVVNLPMRGFSMRPNSASMNNLVLKTLTANRVVSTSRRWFARPAEVSSAPISLSYPTSLSHSAWRAAVALEAQHDMLTVRLTEEMSTMSRQEMIDINKQMARLETVSSAVKLIKSKQKSIADLNKLVTDADSAKASADDKEIAALGKTERDDLVSECQAKEREIIVHLLPPDADDSRNAILECRAGTGGDEAGLFCKDMFEMYEKFAQLQGWRFEVIDISHAVTGGGFKEASALVAGPAVFGTLKYETGGHRVQRVPDTEASGRIHTSAMTVAVLPEAKEVDVVIRDSDLRIDTYRSQGRGGQHVNTTESAVRITHLPSGLSVAIQDERSQLQNRARAMTLLRTRLYDQKRREAQAARAKMRAEQIGSGDRNDRIRTYNFAQGRITDHRINSTKFGIEKMMAGEMLPDFVEELRHDETIRTLKRLDDEASEAAGLDIEETRRPNAKRGKGKS